MIKTFGSVCSGIEAASYVLNPMGVKTCWLSEIEPFTSSFLSQKYPETRNLGDMNMIPEMLYNGEIDAPDLFCGGTPCQAFSLAGWQNGLEDDRGQLTLKYIDILNAIDARRSNKLKKTVFFWENVEGVLSDKTNAFGCFIAGLAGYDDPLSVGKWTSAGILHGRTRNIAWRVLDAKYFGLPQQRKRIYVMGGGLDFFPENVLFEKGDYLTDPYARTHNSADSLLFDENNDWVDYPLVKEENGQKFEVFRSYTDCLYAAYGTKWNGNAAAFNGSLFVSQNDRLRRLTPIECERIMGFPDNHTLIKKCTLTNRFHATGNSWAVNVIEWIMSRLLADNSEHSIVGNKDGLTLFSKEFTPAGDGTYFNTGYYPYTYKLVNFLDYIDPNPNENLYISKAGCAGILRRRNEKKAGMNRRLEAVLALNS